MPSLSTAMAIEAAKPVNEPFLMVHLDVFGDQLWGWTGQTDRTFVIAGDPLLASGQLFLGLAAVGGVSDVLHGADGTIAAVTLTLGFADFNEPATFDFVNYVEQWSQRLAVVWIGYVNSAAGTIIADPARLMTARMVHVAVGDGPEPQIIVKLASKSSSDGQRSSNWKLSDAHQDAFWPGDKALEFVPQLVGKELRFGTPDDIARGTGGGGGSRGGVGGSLSSLINSR